MAVAGRLDGGQLSQATVILLLNNFSFISGLYFYSSSWSQCPYSTSKCRGTEGTYSTIFEFVKNELPFLGSFCYCFLALRS